MPYEVKSTKIRIKERTLRGYRREDFEEVGVLPGSVRP